LLNAFRSGRSLSGVAPRTSETPEPVKKEFPSGVVIIFVKKSMPLRISVKIGESTGKTVKPAMGRWILVQ